MSDQLKGPPAESIQQRTQFRLEEYKSLRIEIDTRIKEAFSLVIYCVTAILVTYGAYVVAATSGKNGCLDAIGQSPPPTACGHHSWLVHSMLWAPILFPLFGWSKSIEAWRNVLSIAEHLRTLECEFGVKESGWEHKAEARRVATKAIRPLFATFSEPPYHWFWFMLLCMTFVISFMEFAASR